MWNTCMVFFQASLLAGYFYASKIIKLSWKHFVSIHLLLISLSLVFMPLLLTPPATVLSPGLSILRQLSTCIFIPYLLLACNGPLLQHLYFMHFHKKHSAYPLYALSNTGSLIGLLGYPFIFENFFTLGTQYRIFFYLFLLFILCLLACLIQKPDSNRPDNQSEPPATPPSFKTKCLWVILSFIPSSLLLGVTSHISFNFGSFPLFWVIPLAIYLSTFIWLFSGNRHSALTVIQRIFPYFLILTALSSYFEIGGREWIFVPIHVLFFSITTLLIHGKLAHIRPHESSLTEFYLWISVGGMLGGSFNSFLAPHLFNLPLEYPMMIALACLTLNSFRPVTLRDMLHILTLPAYFLGLFLTQDAFSLAHNTIFLFWGIIPAFILYLSKNNVFALPLSFITFTFCVQIKISDLQGDTLVRLRNFYGIKSVIETTDHFRILFYGDTNHGMHPIHDDNVKPATFGYYHSNSPFKDVFSFLHQKPGKKRIGVIGLGIGSMSGYLNQDDHMIYYEIDPQVAHLAQDTQWFNYIKTSDGTHEIKISDGRLGIERESQPFDLIILDAFNSDAIPFHLLTTEAITTYLQKLKPGGIIALHITNRYYDLESLLNAGNKILKLNLCFIWDQYCDPEDKGQIPSQWAVLSQDDSLHFFTREKKWQPSSQKLVESPAWSDDNTPLQPYFKWH